MDLNIINKLKNDLKIAIESKDVEKIQLIKNMLNISAEQESYFEKGLTGFPSIDQVWLNKYDENAYNHATNIPQEKTVWDIIEEKLIEYYDVPAIEYFKKQISREDFINSVYAWARTFKAMGVEEDEVVPIYGPFSPDICAMTCALNLIGATAYFLKLAISKEALAEETKESKIAIVYDGMWNNVKEEFQKDKFKKVIISTVTESMPSPKKEIVSFLNYFASKKNKSIIPNDDKYIWVDEAKKISDYYTGNVRAKFVPNRSAFITSSSGTTINGIVKGTVATNESTITQLLMGKSSKIQYYPKDRCLTNFPPTASTSLNCLFFLALYHGLTIVNDPRVSQKDFYNQIIDLKPNVAISTGSMWETFFNTVNKRILNGAKFDFSYAKGWTIGGEGTDPKKYAKWNEIMRNAHASQELFSGYGSSELFSAISVDAVNARSNIDNSRPIVGVGIPYAGITTGVFDENGKELSYNKRGELWIKSNSAMKEYYNKPQETAKTKIDGWIHTGDIAEIDENGYLYIWGRKNDKITINGETLYLFDIANRIKAFNFINDAMIISKPTVKNPNSLVVHLVFENSIKEEEKDYYLDLLNEKIASDLPAGVEILGYFEHEEMLPYSPTTLKKDKNKMAIQKTGYVKIIDNQKYSVNFSLQNDGLFLEEYVIINNKDGVKKLIR